MATVTQLLDALAPQFADSTDKDTFISLASGQVNTCNYGDQSNYAIALMTAHIMTLSARVDGGGGVSSKKEGDLSIGFGSVAGVSGSLSTTPYGILLDGLNKSKNVGIAVTGGCDDGCKSIWPDMVS